MDKNDKKTTFDCPSCSYLGQSKKDLIRHSIVHTGKRPFECSTCQKKFGLKSNLLVHEATHKDTRPYACPEKSCPYRGKSQSALWSHRNSVHLDHRAFPCPRCSYAGKTNSRLTHHLKTHLDDSTRELKKIHACPFCTYKSETKSHLMEHLRTHTGEKPISCPEPFCTYSCTTQANLRVHEVIHTKELKFECSHCSKKFGFLSNMRRHQKIHAEVQPFACTQCSFRTKHKISLARHVKTHSDKRPFKCHQCGYAGRTKAELIKHGKVHLDPVAREAIKTHACPHCEYKVDTSCGLRYHLRMHTGEKPYACSYCEYKTTSSGHLKEHVAYRHTGERKFKCPLSCQFSAVNRATLNVHIRDHIGEKPYGCRIPGCRFTTTSSSVARQHESTCPHLMDNHKSKYKGNKKF